MQHTEREFCQSLQVEWSVSEATYSVGQVKLVLERGKGRPYPDPVGRPGHLVLAEPDLFEVEQSAEVTFEAVRWFQVADEFSDAVAFTERRKNAKFDGRYFRCYTESDLLNELRRGLPDSDAVRLKHYQLVTGDEVVDVLSTQAPHIVLRGGGLK